MKLVASAPNSKPVPESIRGLLTAISQNDLRAVVERISVARPTGTQENEVVRRSVIELFSDTEASQLGVEVDEAGNVVVGNPRRARILIGADYDSVPGTPGADDNASGVSALVAAARAMGPQDEVCYVAFDGEECGFLGSRASSPGLGDTGRSRSTFLRWWAIPVGNRVRSAIRSPASRCRLSVIFWAWSGRSGRGSFSSVSWPRLIAMPCRFRACSYRTCRWR